MKTNTVARRTVLILMLAIHVGIDVFLVSCVSLVDQRWTLFPWRAIGYVLMSLPIAQGCLIALWAATSRTRFALRLPAALVGAGFALIVLLKMLLRSVFDDPGAAALSFAMITQLLSILILVNGGRFAWRQFRAWRTGRTEADQRSTQFSIGQLLLWTTFLAVVLGTGRMALGWLGWTTHVFNNELFYVCQILAILNGLYAIMVLGLFSVRVRWPIRVLLFPLAVAACGAVAWIAALAMTKCFDGLSGPDVVVFVTLAVPQVIYHTGV